MRKHLYKPNSFLTNYGSKEPLENLGTTWMRENERGKKLGGKKMGRRKKMKENVITRLA